MKLIKETASHKLMQEIEFAGNYPFVVQNKQNGWVIAQVATLKEGLEALNAFSR